MNDQLQRSIEASLGWIADHLDLFEIDLDSNFKGKFNTVEMQRKRIGELAILLILVGRNEQFFDHPVVGTIREHIYRHSQTSTFQNSIRRDMEAFPYLVMVHNGLLHSGIRLESCHFLLQQVLDEGFMDRLERTGWNQIDFKYQLESGGFSHAFPDYDTLLAVSSLHHLPNPIYVRNIDVYAITHILFHITDFGRKSAREVLKTNYSKTADTVIALTCHFAQQQDWDLLAELLMCCHHLGLRDFPLFGSCWNALLKGQHQDGSFLERPAPSATPPSHDSNKTSRFLERYHPTLVALFACLLEQDHITQQHAT